MTSNFEQITTSSLPVQPNKVRTSTDLNEIITVPVHAVTTVSAPKTDGTHVEKPTTSAGFVGKLKGRLLSTKSSKSEAESTSKTKLKVVFMPRSEYLKYFAQSDPAKGVYSGSQPAHTWTEEELDEKFAQYVPVSQNTRKPSFMDRVLAPLGAPGA